MRIWRASKRSYVLKRVTASVLLLAATSIVIFVILRIIPGDPTAIRASRPGMTKEQIDVIYRQLGLDRSILEQYVTWIGGVVRGDFGNSYFSSYTTTDLIRAHVPPTVQLAGTAVFMGCIIALILAVLSTIFPGSLIDRASSVLVGAGMAIPSFIVGIALISVFGLQLGWLPTRGYVPFLTDPIENLKFLVLPAATMTLVVVAPLLRLLRAALIDEMGSDYVRTARGTGLSRERVVLTHALRNALIPSLALVGLLVGYLLGGAVVIEYVFSWPGLGTLAVQSVQTRDYAVLQGVVLFAAACFIGASLAVDLISRSLDPRLRNEGK